VNKYICSVCGYIFDENEGVMWNDLPDNWLCPLCGAGKSAFEIQKVQENIEVDKVLNVDESVRSLRIEEYSTLCWNLAKGCEKQYLEDEAKAFIELANYFEGQESFQADTNVEVMLNDIDNEINDTFKNANEVVDSVGDRGSKRALVWSEKVTRMLKSILNKYELEGDSYIENTNVYVCEICGFVYIGDEKPEICPVCKVPNFKMKEIRRD